MDDGQKIILASGSPRRREILENAGFSFTVSVPACDEYFDHYAPIPLAVQGVARQKGNALLSQSGFSEKNSSIVIAADTVVVMDRTVLGKPADRSEAKRMLSYLSGRCHSVFTGVYIFSGYESLSFSERTSVFFRSLSEKDISDYLDTGEYRDKAGAYGIQGEGSELISRIQGDFYNVMGLPIRRVKEALREYFDFEPKCSEAENSLLLDGEFDWREPFPD